MLASVTYSQAQQNLTTLSKMIKSYIILEFDGAPHELNVYNFNYMLEIFSWNIEMIKKVHDIQEKLDKSKEKK